MLILLFEYQNLNGYPNESNICCSPNSYYLDTYDEKLSYLAYVRICMNLCMYVCMCSAYDKG